MGGKNGQVVPLSDKLWKAWFPSQFFLNLSFSICNFVVLSGKQKNVFSCCVHYFITNVMWSVAYCWVFRCFYCVRLWGKAIWISEYCATDVHIKMQIFCASPTDLCCFPLEFLSGNRSLCYTLQQDLSSSNIILTMQVHPFSCSQTSSILMSPVFFFQLFFTFTEKNS